LSVNPILAVVANQSVNEGSPLVVSNIGSFEDVVEGGAGGDGIGLDADDYASIGAFDPGTNVEFNTDTLQITGGFAGMGIHVDLDPSLGVDEIAVFVFSDFEVDAGIIVTARGSRPLAILSKTDLDVKGTIDVSAFNGDVSTPADGFNDERWPGAGGGFGGAGSSDTLSRQNGLPAYGAPVNSVGMWDLFPNTNGGGTGAGHGGIGGRAEGDTNGNKGPVGQSYGDLSVRVRGGSGGATAGIGITVGDDFLAGGGGGGGGIELGANGAITIHASGKVLADGGDGADGFFPAVTSDSVGGGGGGAGGGILIHAKSVFQHGLLSAKGGDGGELTDLIGGGGGGGRILLVHSASGTFSNSGGSQVVTGGIVPSGGSLGGEAGQNGVSQIIAETPSAPIIETFDYVIDWGDGSTDSIGPATIDVPGVSVGDVVEGSFDGSHTYADDGVYTVTVTINDNKGGTDTDVFFVTVNNVVPTVTAAMPSLSVNEGMVATMTGTWGDVGADAVTLSASLGSITQNGDGTWSWSYAAADGLNTQGVTITATDDDLGESSVTFDLTVNNVAPSIVLTGAAATDEGAQYSLSFAATDPGTDTITGWLVNWGDGITEPFAGSAAGGSLTHTYAEGSPGLTRNIIVTAIDEDGSFASSPLAVAVNNVAPTANAGGPYVTFDDWSITLNGSGSDIAGPDDPLTFAWDFNGGEDFEISGEDPVLNPATLGVGVHTIRLKVSDGDGGETVSTTTVTVLGEGTLLIDGVLHVVGNNDANDMVLITQCDGDIKVFATFNDDNPTVFAATLVEEINVRTRGGHDVVVTTPNVVETMTIDGGSENDLLVGGGADDRIYGGSGHDTIYGADGYDMLFAGDGDDDIFGGDGYDVLVGGGGRDILDGGVGRDMLIGGCNEDRLHGGGDDDILIGGYTSHDNNVAVLDEIMQIWGGPASFNDRVTMTTSNGLLIAGSTVFDDAATDHIIGAAGRDLAFADTAKWDGVKDTVSLSSAQDTLIAVNS
jgi:hypothetical protein